MVRYRVHSGTVTSEDGDRQFISEVQVTNLYKMNYREVMGTGAEGYDKTLPLIDLYPQEDGDYSWNNIINTEVKKAIRQEQVKVDNLTVRELLKMIWKKLWHTKL